MTGAHDHAGQGRKWGLCAALGLGAAALLAALLGSAASWRAPARADFDSTMEAFDKEKMEALKCKINDFTFFMKGLLHSNLDGQGPDKGKHGLFYKVQQVWTDGRTKNVTLVVHALSPFIGKPEDNGLNGLFAEIVPASGTELNLSFILKDGPKVYVPEAIHLSFYDLDTAKDGKSTEYVHAHGKHLSEEANDTELIKEADGHGTKYTATVVGNAADNPTDPGNLTDEQKRRSVTFTYIKPKDPVKLTVGSSSGGGYRAMMFTLRNSVTSCPKIAPKATPNYLMYAIVAACLLLLLLLFVYMRNKDSADPRDAVVEEQVVLIEEQPSRESEEEKIKRIEEEMLLAIGLALPVDFFLADASKSGWQVSAAKHKPESMPNIKKIAEAMKVRSATCLLINVYCDKVSSASDDALFMLCLMRSRAVRELLVAEGVTNVVACQAIGAHKDGARVEFLIIPMAEVTKIEAAMAAWEADQKLLAAMKMDLDFETVNPTKPGWEKIPTKLKDASIPFVKKIAEAMKGEPDKCILINGYCGKGSTASKEDLTLLCLKRARCVRDMLRKEGVKNKLASKGVGPDKDGARVEFKIVSFEEAEKTIAQMKLILAEEAVEAEF